MDWGPLRRSRLEGKNRERNRRRPLRQLMRKSSGRCARRAVDARRRRRRRRKKIDCDRQTNSAVFSGCFISLIKSRFMFGRIVLSFVRDHYISRNSTCIYRILLHSLMKKPLFYIFLSHSSYNGRSYVSFNFTQDPNDFNETVIQS